MLTEALLCLALNVYHEARDQPPAGQLAVAHVVVNRTIDRRFPDTVCGVILQGGEVRNRCQFSWYCDGRSDEPFEREAWTKAKQVARKVLLTGPYDPTKGALYYHALYVDPFWASTMEYTVTIGMHKFYKEKWR